MVGLPNPKSRGNWNIGMCLRDCSNREVEGKCDGCVRFSNFSGSDICDGDVRSANVKDKCVRHDFEYTKKLDKVLGEYRNFKNPKDRKKITAEYFGRQQEYRNKVVSAELKQKYG